MRFWVGCGSVGLGWRWDKEVGAKGAVWGRGTLRGVFLSGAGLRFFLVVFLNCLVSFSDYVVTVEKGAV